jgi:acylphosphatase
MIHILISGDVQGVGFRQFVKYQARKLNIKGWVKNLPDGKVEGMFQGSEQDLEKMIKFVKNGHPIATVKDVKIEEVPDQEFDSFKVIKE